MKYTYDLWGSFLKVLSIVYKLFDNALAFAELRKELNMYFLEEGAES